MVMNNLNLYATLARQTAMQRDLAQAVPRPTRVRFFVTTEGNGEVRLAGNDAVFFSTYFLEKPTLATGFTLPDGDQGSFPTTANAMVTSYVQDAQGLYTGAELGFVVSAPSAIKVEFSLTFEAYALRSTVIST